MSEVKRYDSRIGNSMGLSVPCSEMYANPTGQFVTYSDYQKLVAENAAYKSAEIMEFLRLVECMTGDYNDSNHGDAREWIRHIAKASSDFEDKHGDTPWGRMKGLAAINTAAAIAEIVKRAIPQYVVSIIDSGELESICWQSTHSESEHARLAIYNWRQQREKVVNDIIDSMAGSGSKAARRAANLRAGRKG